MGERPKWFPDWSGETAVIVAAGPSANKVNIEIARDRAKFIAVNNSWKLAPWSDMLYACDFAWWEHAAGCPEFKGAKVTSDRLASREYSDVLQVYCSRIVDTMNFDDTDEIGWGGNSGFGAINLAAKFGAKRIVLVGFDMRIDRGAHWHGHHPNGMHNPSVNNVGRWRRALDKSARRFEERGIEVLNCSAVSKLSAYPKVEFEEIFETAERV